MFLCQIDLRHYNCIFLNTEIPQDIAERMEMAEIETDDIELLIENAILSTPALIAAQQNYGRLITFAFIQEKDAFIPHFSNDNTFCECDWVVNIAFAFGQDSAGIVESDSKNLLNIYKSHRDDEFTISIFTAQLLACAAYFESENIKMSDELSAIYDAYNQYSESNFDDDEKESYFMETKSRTAFHKWLDVISLDDYNKTFCFHRINGRYIVEVFKFNAKMLSTLEEYGFCPSSLSKAMIKEHSA